MSDPRSTAQNLPPAHMPVFVVLHVLTAVCRYLNTDTDLGSDEKVYSTRGNQGAWTFLWSLIELATAHFRYAQQLM